MNRTEICNYADDVTIYLCDSKVENVIESLEQDAIQLSTWCPDIDMKLNVDKCHLKTFCEKDVKMELRIREALIEESDEVTLLGITLDTRLSFKTHVQKASQKLHALSRISIFMEPEKIKLITKTFVISQFSYCPLI